MRVPDTKVISPIRAFFATANRGHSPWWSWLAIAWFALMLWFYGQMIFGVLMGVVMLFSDPAALQNMAEQAGTNASGDSTQMAVFLIIALSFLSFLLFVLRSQFSGISRRIANIIAATGALISFVLLIYILKVGNDPDSAAMLNQLMGDSPAIYALVLMMFPPMAIGLVLGVKFVQKRPVLSLLTAHRRFRWRRLVFAAILVWAIAAVATWIGHVTGASPVRFVFDPKRFWVFLPVTLLLIPLQSATEEIMLRGFATQGMGQYIKNPWVVFFITSAAFASLHLGNPEVAETIKEHSMLTAIGGYFMFGMFASLMVWIDGGLEAAIGMHVANNVFAAAVVGYESSALPTPTIFKIGLDTSLDNLTVFISMSLVCLILYLTRKPVQPQARLEDIFE
ncbi:MAG TPA: CPBP family intramembrane metalloprotease [Hellea balneolensis]|uniref:CPBP family intramembrane metalloprotease n=1 Tax=Hellea balneolensis TaxID=287478 RepID=A0A7V5U0V2_9PROT|nr:CPBP family intramembrane metalloprotease [Hellea balneolensis]